MPTGVISVKKSDAKEPKEFLIPSQSWPITAEEAANILTKAEEVKMNKPLHKAASKMLQNQLLAKRKAQLEATQLAGQKGKG